ncbi:MAG: hypothetical protein ACO1RT_00220 [Planctomycetaceae bacterium]
MRSLLQRCFEDLLVGYSTTLILLAMLSSSQLRPLPVKTAAPADNQPASAAQDFAAQWRQIAGEFYAAHPVEDSTAPGTMLSQQNKQSDRATVGISPMSLVSHRLASAKTAAPPAAAPGITEPEPRPRASLGGYALAASLAAGVLAVMLYRSVWPATAVLPQRSLDCSHNLRIELPSEWVQVRPGLRAQLRPFVLLATQAWAAIAVSSILR